MNTERDEESSCWLIAKKLFFLLKVNRTIGRTLMHLFPLILFTQYPQALHEAILQTTHLSRDTAVLSGSVGVVTKSNGRA